MNEEEVREKYKTLTKIIGQTLEDDSGILFHMYAHKFCRDYYRDFKPLRLCGNPFKVFGNEVFWGIIDLIRELWRRIKIWTNT